MDSNYESARQKQGVVHGTQSILTTLQQERNPNKSTSLKCRKPSLKAKMELRQAAKVCGTYAVGLDSFYNCPAKGRKYYK